jgi:nitrite reductase/ring-hydroxylating ferredoxin subunit
MNMGPCHPRAYPNPCRSGDKVCFRVDGGLYQKVDCSIYTVSSRCMHRESREIRNAEDQVFDWSLQDDHGVPVANGIYLAVFKIQTGFKTETHIAKVCILR